jgi:glycosyltransferase involved in cell wall biosynthesis
VRIALIAPPFITVPPEQYGGTELFLAQLAEGLQARGVETVVYTNGRSSVSGEKRWLYPEPHWPLSGDYSEFLMEVNHSCWSIEDAMEDCDLVHLNSAAALAASRFTNAGVVYTVHHAKEPFLTDYYRTYKNVHFVCISEFQRKQCTFPNSRTIHHGVDMDEYVLPLDEKREYLAFLGRIAPVKGAHLAIQVAKKAGIPLKIAGEIQPMFRDYFEAEVKPHIDGTFIEFVGEVGLAEKNILLGGAMALLFPIQWDEPFGLVMTEAMACGAPVLAFPGGSVNEIVQDGVSGFVCSDVDEMADRAKDLGFAASQVRAYVEEHFSRERMVDNYLRLYAEIIESRQQEASSAA